MAGGRTALIVVDMQNAFLSDTVAGLAIADADAVLRNVNTHIGDAVAHGRPVFYTQDIAPTDLSPDQREQVIALHPSLDVRGPVVPKGPGRTGGFSGFVLAAPDGGGPGTGGLSGLGGHLGNADVDSVVVVGVAADVCVAATARDASRLGYDVTVALEATAFVHANPAGDDAAVAQLHAAGITVTGLDRI